MYYLYILYSQNSDKYYLGYTNDYNRRLKEHNEQTAFVTYTSKHRPWVLKAVFAVSKDEKDAIQIERYIKKQKSRKLVALLCNDNFIPTGKLAQLVRVPYLRD
jgi:putative endonuclease